MPRESLFKASTWGRRSCAAPRILRPPGNSEPGVQVALYPGQPIRFFLPSEGKPGETLGTFHCEAVVHSHLILVVARACKMTYLFRTLGKGVWTVTTVDRFIQWHTLKTSKVMRLHTLKSLINFHYRYSVLPNWNSKNISNPQSSLDIDFKILTFSQKY